MEPQSANATTRYIPTEKFYVGVGLVTLIAIACFITLIIVLFSPRSGSAILIEDGSSKINRVDQIEADVQKLTQRLDALNNIPPENALGKEVSTLKAEQAGYETRLKTFEAAISNSPEKALSLPLIRKDLEALQARVSAIQEATHNDVERIYTLFVWFLGSLITVGLAVLGFIFTHGRKGNSGKEQPAES